MEVAEQLVWEFSSPKKLVCFLQQQFLQTTKLRVSQRSSEPVRKINGETNISENKCVELGEAGRRENLRISMRIDL